MAEKVLVKLESYDITKILVAVFVILITIVLFALYKRKKSAKNGILLTGLCDSGKTLIFTQLIYKKQVLTHTSIKENVGNFVTNGNDVLKIIDIPGHERLREKFFEEYKNVTRGIVFVVDSSTVQQNIRDAAEYLYNILCDSTIANNCPKLLILCNKQDQSLSKGRNVIKSIFEKELNTLKITKSNQLQSVDPKANKSKIILGSKDGEFSFSGMNMKVEFAESYAQHKNGSVNLDTLKDWINNTV